ncbi:MAG: hypothetical protein IBX48_09235 [Thiomicrospira sp.]|uniref:hypothetical protein n=1 Tax=Thiomicrospira sp. TaxID=935 RepID=UPI0019F35411|nr:hypothetical protein [Thiomicrospira sp.]MBE0494507.1 hypothetical protein [Thiomicrospira sp.]
MQLAIELPDELAKRIDINTLSQDFIEFAMIKYGIGSSVSAELILENDPLNGIPFVADFANVEPLATQQAMRDEWS